MPKVTVRIGNAAMIRMAVHRMVQVKMGMRIQVMPGARILTMVTKKLTPVSRVPRPVSCSDQM